MAESKSLPLTYKGHPLRRKDNLIYYGSMADPYIIMLQILSTEKVKDMEDVYKRQIIPPSSPGFNFFRRFFRPPLAPWKKMCYINRVNAWNGKMSPAFPRQRAPVTG